MVMEALARNPLLFRSPVPPVGELAVLELDRGNLSLAHARRTRRHGPRPHRVDQRGPLLADDEVTLLEQILDEPRRLWEITAVEQGESLTLRDTGSGDRLTATAHAGVSERLTRQAG